MLRKEGFIRIDGDYAKKLLRSQGYTASSLSRALYRSPSWLSANLKIGSIHREDVKRLQELGCDLSPALITVPTVWVLKFDLGLILKVIIMTHNGDSIRHISNTLGIDWKTVKRYTETWKETRFGMSQELIEQMLTVFTEEAKEEG